MRIQNKFLTIVSISASIALFGIFHHSIIGDSLEAKSNSSQDDNFNDDLTNASTYWKHNKLGRVYFDKGDYAKAIEEYKAAIKIIEDSSDEYTRTDVGKEYREKVNHDLKVSSQIFSRYRLIEVLEKAGRYEEALQNVEWLIENQQMKGKEDLLRRRLDGMKKDLLQKIKGDGPLGATPQE